jgi:hypothetical protein
MFQDFDCTITDAAHTGKVVHRELALLPQNKIYSYGDSLPHK